MSAKKILLISYYWPPAGGPGVQRWYKLTKYLLQQGCEIDLITVDPAQANYPVRDYSLIEDFKTDKLRVFTTDNFDIFNFIKKFKKNAEYPISGFANEAAKIGWKTILVRRLRNIFLLPDPRKFWNKYALQQAKELLKSNTYDSVITTSPPHSTQLIGLELKKCFPDLKWIVDFRDPWTDIYYYHKFFHTNSTYKRDLAMEKSVVETCDRLIVAGDKIKTLFAEKYGEKVGTKTHVVTNGFDPEDFTEIHTPKKENINLVYTGTIANYYPINTLIDVLESLAKENITIELTFVGKVDAQNQALIAQSSIAKQIHQIGFVDHQKAIEHMQLAHVLLLIIPDHEHNEIHVPGKLFEYMAAKRQILNLGPTDGFTAELIEKSNSGITYNYTDYDAIKTFLKNAHENFILEGKSVEINNECQQFSRAELAKKVLIAVNQ